LPHLGEMLHEYYEFRQWTKYGIPTAAKLEQVGLSGEAALLKKLHLK
jgi:aldehyde:ferredoxin oxidoreductase